MANERKKEFQRNTDLENLLKEINTLLAPANAVLKADAGEKYSKIFVMGNLRSGTTLFTQWLAATGLVAYPTNLLSRFYGTPLVGAKIQQLLTDPRYNFRNEILDFNSEINFSSENGKTRGALAPNEFWYFWRRFLPFTELDYLPDEELLAKGDLTGLRDELNGLANIFGKPFMLKGMIMNQNIPVLDSLFEKSLFIWIRRDPVFNIQSALEARRRQYGNIDTWYSFKIREYPTLKNLSPLESVAGQIYAINSAISAALAQIPEQKKMTVQYEEFCQQPERFFTMIRDKLACQHNTPAETITYQGLPSFDSTNEWKMKEYSLEEATQAYGNATLGISSVTYR